MLRLKEIILSLVVLTTFASSTSARISFSSKTFLETSPRIINGSLANANETLHQVSVRRKRNDSYFFGTGHICGGSLIAPNVVLSAAHCFVDASGNPYPAEDFIVVAGTLNRFDRTNNTLVFDIEKLILNVSQFNSSTFENDVALAILNASVPENHPTADTILLNRGMMPAQTMCNVTGWGETEDGYLSDQLMTVAVPVIDNGICSNETDFDEGLIRDGMMCAGFLDEGEYDACSGDSGGPLVCKRLLTGIVSWGFGCALPKLPGVYTDVAYYAPWIEEKLLAENITLPKNGGTSATATISSLLVLLSFYNFISFFTKY